VRAIILAGGKGTRLRPYTVVLPKPLMPVGDYPIVEVIIRQLVFFGFNHVTMAVNHQAELIKSFFGTGKRWNIKIDYSIEDMPLSTMAPLKIIKRIPDNFLVMNGDILTDFDFKVFYDYHVLNHHLFTIASARRRHQIDYGVLKINKSKLLYDFKEKPIIDYDVSMGIYMINKKILSYIPENTAYGFDNLMVDLTRKSVPINIEHHKGFWLDIGRPEDYSRAVVEFEQNKNVLLK
jgi:NDP-sugar pyrophosphorylase family protein